MNKTVTNMMMRKTVSYHGTMAQSGTVTSQRRYRMQRSFSTLKSNVEKCSKFGICCAMDAETSASLAQATGGLDGEGSGAGVSGDVSRVASLHSSGPPQAKEWQLDFCSRPMLDERGKKIWELLICSPDRSFEYSRFFPNNKINSGELRKALEEILAEPGAVCPENIRFFRAQMQTIITRAISDMNITPIPSRRCFALTKWLEERLETVYKVHRGYSEKATTLFNLDLGAPEELPDALRGESWSFVQLPLSALREELKAVETKKAFGCTLDIGTVGLDGLTDETPVPGVAVYSRRAAPLAAWTNGLELSALVADTDRSFLILETGVNQRWRYGAYRRTLETTAEAQAWEDAKQAIGGLHFLAVMTDEEAEDCAGLWMLLDRKPPSI